MLRVRLSTWIVPAAATLTGAALGVLGDAFAGGVSLDPAHVAWALFFSPLTAVMGGGMVDAPGHEGFLLIAGLLFWPVYALLLWAWLRWRRVGLALALAVWSSVGFFQTIHRFEGLMSV